MAGKSEIVKHAFRTTDLSKQKAAEAVDAIFQAITNELANGERVTVQGFGSFAVRERTARQGRNPATGERISIPAGRTVVFRKGAAHKTLAPDPKIMASPDPGELPGNATIDFPDEDTDSD